MNKPMYSIIFGLIIHGIVNYHTKALIMVARPNLLPNAFTTNFKLMEKSSLKTTKEFFKIRKSLNATNFFSYVKFSNPPQQKSHRKQRILKSKPPNLSVEKQSGAQYVQQPPIYSQIPMAPPVYQQPGISNSISTSNSQSVVYPNGVTNSVSSSQSNSFSQSVSQGIHPIQPISPIEGPVPFGQAVPQAPAYSQSQASATSFANGYGSASISQASSSSLAGAGSYRSFTLAHLQVLTDFRPSLLFQRAKRSLKINIFANELKKLENRHFTINKDALKALMSLNGTLNIAKIIDNSKDENTVQPRTFNLIMDAINAFLNPPLPPCQPPCPRPPILPPPPPPPPPPPMPCRPIPPCQNYPYCPLPPCYPPCQPLPPCRPPYHMGYYPQMLPNETPPPIPVPECDKSKPEKNVIENPEQKSRSELSDQSDDSGEQITKPCYRTGTSHLKSDSPQQIPPNHPLHQQIYTTYPMNNVYPLHPPNTNIITIDPRGSSIIVSSSAVNSGPFSSSSASAISNVNSYGYYEAYSQSSQTDQTSTTGEVKLLASSITTAKRLTNDSYEIERVFTVPCQNGSLYQIRLVTIEPENGDPYPKRTIQTITVIPSSGFLPSSTQSTPTDTTEKIQTTDLNNSPEMTNGINEKNNTKTTEVVDIEAYNMTMSTSTMNTQSM